MIATANKLGSRLSAPPAPLAPPARRTVKFGEVNTTAGHRVVLYGPGGIGKTCLAAQLPGPVAFVDLDESLGKLRAYLTANKIISNLMPVEGVASWLDLRAVLQSDGWDKIKTIVVDTGTRAEELAVAHTLGTVLHEKGQKCNSVEDYGYGKGFGHVFDTFLPLLADLDRHCRAGRNVAILCHDCTCTVPNPAGEDWLRYEPRLQSPASGKASIRLRVREWADHVLFMGYDLDVTKEGKGRGAGTKTIYTSELPHFMAKSRTCQQSIPVGTDGEAVWSEIIK
jgi:hypothetical protein